MEKKLQNISPGDYNLVVVQDVWQVHYQMFSLIILKEFIILNVNRPNEKKVETCRIKYKKCDCFLECTDF